ncbi:hypothetical protein [Amycolatopsis sp. NPDC003731]
MRKVLIGLACLFVAGCGANSTTNTSSTTTTPSTGPESFNYVISVAPGNTLDVTTDKGLPPTELATAYDDRLKLTVTQWGINDKPSAHVTGKPAFCTIADKTGAIVGEVKKTDATDMTCYVP